MKTFWSLMRSVLLFVLFILFMLCCVVAPIGILYVKAINLIQNMTLRYVVSMVYFIAAAKGVMWIGRKGMRWIFQRDE